MWSLLSLSILYQTTQQHQLYLQCPFWGKNTEICTSLDRIEVIDLLNWVTPSLSRVVGLAVMVSSGHSTSSYDPTTPITKCWQRHTYNATLKQNIEIWTCLHGPEVIDWSDPFSVQGRWVGRNGYQYPGITLPHQLLNFDKKHSSFQSHSRKNNISSFQNYNQFFLELIKKE